jgi:hypothetical protein
MSLIKANRVDVDSRELKAVAVLEHDDRTGCQPVGRSK